MQPHACLAARLWRPAVLALGILSGLACAQPPAHWTVVELTSDSPGGGIARAVNNRGDVVGQTFTSAGGGIFGNVSHAFVWRNGTREDIEPAGSKSSVAWAVNPEGTIVGSVDGIASVWNDGQASSLQVVGQALGIDERGDIVGQYWTSGTAGSGNDWPFLSRQGAVYTLPTLGGFESAAVDINGAGVAVGHSLVGSSNATHAVLWDQGAIRDLGTLGGRQSFAIRINNRGDIVGQAEDEAGRFFMVRWHAGGGPVEKLLERSMPTAIDERGDIVGNNQDTGAAFLYQDGVVTALLDLPAMKAGGWQSFSPMGINDRGWIVGSAWKPGVAFVGTALLLIPD